MAQWIGFQLSIWHEIATWFGWSWTKTFPETASSFSPEDLYSNVLGVKLFAALVPRSSARTEYLYNDTVDNWLEGDARTPGFGAEVGGCRGDALGRQALVGLQ